MLPVWLIIILGLFLDFNLLFLVSGLALLAQERFSYRVASTPWDPDSGLGNHPAVVRVKQKAEAVFARLPWAGDPRPLGKAWDECGISQAEMTGYWSLNCPVKTDKPGILATVYQKKGTAMVAIASWSDKPESCRVIVEWKNWVLTRSVSSSKLLPSKIFKRLKFIKLTS